MQSEGGTSYQKGGYELLKERVRVTKTEGRASRSSYLLCRYAYGGAPLWSGVPPESVPVPACAGCGAERVFEFQLTSVTLAPDTLLLFFLKFRYNCIHDCVLDYSKSVGIFKVSVYIL